MPDQSIKAAVIGVGYLGALHAKKYQQIAFADLVGVFDEDSDRSRAVAAEIGCSSFASLEEALEASEAVSVAVPTLAHRDVGRAVLAAGRHLLMEKPLAASYAEGLELKELAERASLIVQVGHLERFNPVIVDVQRIVTAPRFIECHRLSPFGGRGGDTSVVFDVMIHDLDLLAYLVGRPVESVEAAGVPILSDHVDIANARLRFEGGCIANVTASRVSLRRERKLRLFQSDAYVSMDFDERSAMIARRKPGVDTIDPGRPMDAIDAEKRAFGDADPLLNEIEHFVDCVQKGHAPLVGIDDGLEALALAEKVSAELEDLREAEPVGHDG